MPPQELYYRVLASLGVDPATIPPTLDTATWRRMVLVALAIPVDSIPPTLDTATWRQMVLQGIRANPVPSLLDVATWRRAALAALGLAIDTIPPTIDTDTWNNLLLTSLALFVAATNISLFWSFTAAQGTVVTGLAISATAPTTFSVSLGPDSAYPAVAVSAYSSEVTVPDLTLP
jgi:hypothetical protein